MYNDLKLVADIVMINTFLIDIFVRAVLVIYIDIDILSYRSLNLPSRDLYLHIP